MSAYYVFPKRFVQTPGQEFLQFLRIANGSRTELETHLLLAVRIGLVRDVQIAPLLEHTTILGKQIVTLERSLSRQNES